MSRDCFVMLLAATDAAHTFVHTEFCHHGPEFFAGTLSYFAGTLSFSLEIDLSFFRGQIFGFFSTKVLPFLPSLPSERPLILVLVSVLRKSSMSV